ncbi:DNA mismatch repair endonuclease MutL [Amylibacter sp.]|jgi:DNA mismatch repair protein MutL|nr:DNA mismatch repair endonuclease MutL [Amylibacter sp.]MDB4188390.1 DNA mismatch repair endonuclease MutL [bacterium]MDA8913735.1 DNA mismatch repair endonuclease MutL [Amylibacter sp.]MDA9178210.1 DNA mismatch repair endonuclease MutL [Amylibacter sp.]MDA9229379.1 DNA mismatch repair endonuclease MutL [Amylibacter sp.]|tara:strand:+ start:3752 stop:5587 length:1836 start_codon:yes stop_codon:yes gene_type:complete
MELINQRIKNSQPIIKQLSEAAANRIAAGEVVERPSSAIKELVENSVDAGASRIDISYSDGGKTLIVVKDDGHGIAENQLQLALSRHATSKIDGSDLLNINTFGFRGEALPSMGAVGRLTITSRIKNVTMGSKITVNGGLINKIRPAPSTIGTVVELRDLFHATPARLKFLRTDRSESGAISDVVKRLAMAEPFIGFTLRDVTSGGEGRIIFRADPETGDLFDAMHGRLTKILGVDFSKNCFRIEAEREGISLTGYASLPTYSRGSSIFQYVFVNGRPVKDKNLLSALRAAYSDFLPNGRYPVVALFVECDFERVDVNVHPAKAEVRFREPGIVRGLVVSGLRHALAEEGHRSSSTIADATLGSFKKFESSHDKENYQMNYSRSGSISKPNIDQVGFLELQNDFSARNQSEEVFDELISNKLGAARAQVHENYILSQTSDGIIIVDQHAAHERLVYERLKKQMSLNGVSSQTLLIPEIIELSEQDSALLMEISVELDRFGLGIENFGGSSIIVRETPAILGEVNSKNLILDILDELKETSHTNLVKEKLDAILSRIACHGSIRSGRIMRAEEMNALLREMEVTPHSGQCNHGRPTYVELKLSDIEKLFGRT